MCLHHHEVLCDPGTSTETYKVGDCGIRFSQYKPRIAYGFPSKYNEFPWHVALYKLSNASRYDYMCGGSIIDNNIVITAAHCVFDEEQQDLDYSRMVIATGKYNGSWEHRDVHEQRLEVISKKVRRTYRGTDNRFQDDIALLALNDSIKFSSVVMPVCIDWDSSYEPNDGEMGTFVGWGYNEKNVLSEKLQVSRMEQRNFGECRNKVSKGYTSFLTSDKFCAASIDMSELEQGDSGGGLVFSRSLGTETEAKERYFIYGILSGRENSNGYYFFTNVSNHMPWINSTKMNIIDETNVRKVCGIRNVVNSTEPGGYISSYSDYPWLATIYMTKKNKFFGIRCVGSIIHQRAIITSYWCIRDGRPHYKGVEFRIIIGKHEMNMKEEEEDEQYLNVGAITIITCLISVSVFTIQDGE
ncbi:chymotrypsin-like elastase family member 2A isoform X2 [Halyomorpha halys]|uniref:chymotrypsin-like elastase family member 2A isoform X2 n=1 Tax=Halyomorpha halys TaxID=286706 RepID=UPI0006D4EB86|nr:modular serine protease-like isoform X2 [Halyomorpha halys]